MQLPSPGSAWHFSNVKAKGCRAARQPSSRGSTLGQEGLGTRRGTRTGMGTGRGAGEGEGTPAAPAAVIVILAVEVVGWGRWREPVTG